MDTTTRITTRRISQYPLRSLVATLGVALAATLAATLAPIASAQPGGGPGMGMMGYEGGPGMGHHGGGRHGMGMEGRYMSRMLDAVKATPEQRAQIKTITDAARADMQAQREAGRALHEQGRAVFTQPNIDANAAEALRQQMLAHHDQASKRGLRMMLDVAAVLSPEQRKTLADLAAQRRAKMERHHGARGAAEGKPAR